MYRYINNRDNSKVLEFNKWSSHVIILMGVFLLTLFVIGAIPSYGNETISNNVKVEKNKDNLPEMNEFIPVDSEPVVTFRQPPEYPKIAENAGITGAVYVKALVDEKGSVLKSEIYKSSGYVWLDEAAKEATAHNKYKPAIYKEKPVLYWVTHKVDFVLE